MSSPIAMAQTQSTPSTPVAPITQDIGERIPTIRLTRLFPHCTLHRPLQVLQAPGDDTHLYVLEQAGRIVRLDLANNQSSEAFEWLDIRERVNCEGNEEGLLSMAFDPHFEQNGAFFLYYTARKPRRSELTRFQIDIVTGLANPDSAKVLLKVKQPYSNHNGGTLLFGPDGMLYLSLGDGGAANDPHGNGQNMQTLLAKIIRIDVHHDAHANASQPDKQPEQSPQPTQNKEAKQALQEKPYAIPADNPFVNTPNAAPEIWAVGLRNVWRMSFDRATGLLYAGDVGQNTYEEIDLITKGGNYGWNVREGLHAFEQGHHGNAEPQFIQPIAEYSHADGVSVTGGYVYRGAKFPALQGVYLYADFTFGTIWGLRCDGVRSCTPTVVWHRQGGNSMWSSFGQLNNGELLLCAFDGVDSGLGSLWKIEAAQ